MALLVTRPTGNLAVVVSKDGAVGCDPKGYEAYTKSFADGHGDEAILQLKGEPTRFLLKPDLDWAAKQRLRSNRIKVQGNKVQIDANYSSDLLRLHLVGIQNPAGAPADKTLSFSKDPDGLAGRELVNLLDKVGVVGDLVGALQAVNCVEAEVQEKNA